MRRRDFLNAIAGSAAAWPLTVRAQQGDRKRRLGIILGGAAEESETKARITVFLQELRHLGWDEGRNIQIEMRASAGNAGATRKYAAELVTFAPDVILALGGSTVAPLLEATHTVPIVFTITSDPVGNGFVDSLARPGGNVTGFMTFDYGLSGKGPRRKLHQQGRGARGHETANHFASLRRWEGQAAYEKAVREIYGRDPDRARKLGLPQPARM